MFKSKILLYSTIILTAIVFVSRAFVVPMPIHPYSYEFTSNTILLIILGLYYLIILSVHLRQAYKLFLIKQDWKKIIKQVTCYAILFAIILAVMIVFSAQVHGMLVGGRTYTVKNITNEFIPQLFPFALIFVSLSFMAYYGLISLVSGLCLLITKGATQREFALKLIKASIVWIIVGGFQGLLLLISIFTGDQLKYHA